MYLIQFLLLFRHWLMARKDMILAKGKGMMQTYWCEPSLTRNVAASATENLPIIETDEEYY
jgi:hypothetical protein